jgi:hypothetical protein
MIGSMGRRPGIVKQEARPPRLLVLAFALVFLFETWIWGSVVAAVRALATLIPWDAFKAEVQRQLNRLPALVALVLFGVPLLFNEFGALFCVILMATGHFLSGAVGYVLVKVVGLGLLAVIFELTREKLMTLPWFVFAYDKFQTLHDFASRLVAPYRNAVLAHLKDLRDRARAFWMRVAARARGEPG